MVSAETQTVACLDCRHVWSKRIPPLHILTGASGVGKSAIIPTIRQLLPHWIILDKDLIWSPDENEQVRNWLRIAHEIAQAGHNTLLVGLFLSEQIEQADYRKFFYPIHKLNLHVSDAVRAERLRARPAWRNWNEARILENAALASRITTLPTLDATELSIEQTAKEVARWVKDSQSSEGLAVLR